MSHSNGAMDDFPPEDSIQRMSALYQYHNAPEVAPAHGLEYDDSHYPHSDKFPVIHSTPVRGDKWSRSHQGFGYDGHSPRIIFGMKVRTFLVVAIILIMVVVGAAVGGAVGGNSIKNTASTIITNSTSTSNSTTTAASAIPSQYTAPQPTYQPLNDCPAANNTIYASTYSSGMTGASQVNAKLNFTRYCNFANPLSHSDILSSSFTYTFEDCIELCASSNLYSNNGACRVAAYQSNATRPTNCWIGSRNTSIGDLTAQSNISIALIRS